jgi:hypothetical protein
MSKLKIEYYYDCPAKYVATIDMPKEFENLDIDDMQDYIVEHINTIGYLNFVKDYEHYKKDDKYGIEFEYEYHRESKYAQIYTELEILDDTRKQVSIVDNELEVLEEE